MIGFKTKTALSIVGAIAIAAAGLVGSTQASAAQSHKFKVAMVTHGQVSGMFWNTVRNGAEAAAKKDHIKLIYLPSPVASGQAQMLDNVIQQHVDGIALTLAFPDAMEPGIKKAQAAGIPIVAFNAGETDWKKMGIPMFVGQDESIAGQAIGRKLNALGAKDVVCVNHQQGAVQLAARCSGIKDTYKGKFETLYVSGHDLASGQSRIQAKLQQDPNIDYVVTLAAMYAPPAVSAIGATGSHAKVATFDLNPRVVKLIKQGKVQFAVDQQPYVEGYEAVDLLWLYLTNGDVVGGGKAVLTGPAFVTTANIDTIAKSVKRGTR